MVVGTTGVSGVGEGLRGGQLTFEIGKFEGISIQRDWELER